MKYIDSGNRHPDQALGSWLDQVAAQGISELRMQSGYFSLDGLGLLEPAIRAIAAANGAVRIVIGSNDGMTLGSHVEQLADILGLPRTNANLGVVSFSNSIFHPKTLHLVRSDRSRAAYVGSANMGRSAVSGLNVEAGLLLDEHEGDAVDVITAIGDGVDAWFNPARSGIEMVYSAADVAALVSSGTLATVRPPRVRASGAGGATGAGRPGLSPLVQLPAILQSVAAPPPPPPAAARPSTSLPGYPAGMRFAPASALPTIGGAAVSGTLLPNGAVGVILRLSKDTCRFWLGKGGTANITIPKDAIEPLRFGFNSSGKPRAEFVIEARRVHLGGTDVVTSADTNIMAYGYGPSPTGHKDIRLVLPRPVSDGLAAAAAARGAPVPSPGDYAMLEWPTTARPTFRFSIVDPTSPTYANILAVAATATGAGTLLGPGGCWLPSGVSPIW